MKIAIIGTRGIPNNYGGFEQLAEWLSTGLQKRGHEVYVYNSHTHPYKQESWKGVHLIHKYDPEYLLGAMGQFIYDLNCIADTRSRKFDVILNLGYTSSSVWMRLFPRGTRVITNMDGLEWKRSKYSRPVKGFLKHAERWAVRHSSSLVADSRYIQAYIRDKYRRDPHYIAYGAELFAAPDEQALESFGVKPFGYDMIVARMEPENNIEMILDGIHRSGSQLPFFVVGGTENRFGRYLKHKFRNNRNIVFTGPIYTAAILNSLRHFCRIYFHGHSVGGTNPSLLEAMGCKAFIVAHDNQFNRGVLGEDTFYFSKVEDIAILPGSCDRFSEKTERMIANNFEKIQRDYSWEKIIAAYETLLLGGQS